MVVVRVWWCYRLRDLEGSLQKKKRDHPDNKGGRKRHETAGSSSSLLHSHLQKTLRTQRVSSWSITSFLYLFLSLCIELPSYLCLRFFSKTLPTVMSIKESGTIR
ncbi:hypothetical protein BO86DRAFT_3726 [Aspergillus japonicus CBS 114.51]|uniref:Uncharacterized protein n=1 Tax=Aspergillus japonicus CBS 114.51 TaxID=1448312 RepID=A0A8T8XHS6_ASPJA|nr:hypothetical protein BO86DRAFT_3726 [Aspergillus japonicus CBS 114.51]RAH87468.1 hypothetical protein BO86DRAFT_3726 [Aspergillus japonicus CBS 114.51]